MNTLDSNTDVLSLINRLEAEIRDLEAENRTLKEALAKARSKAKEAANLAATRSDMDVVAVLVLSMAAIDAALAAEPALKDKP
jgi:hypothetical protein